MNCTHGMPTPASCVECMEGGNIPPKPTPKRKGWPFEAQYAGQCSGCDCDIEAGDKIVLMADETYRHVGSCEKIRK